MMNWSDVLMYYLLVIQILLLGYLTTKIVSFISKIVKKQAKDGDNYV